MNIDIPDEDSEIIGGAPRSPLYMARLEQAMRNIHLSWRLPRLEMPQGLRDNQIMIDVSLERERERQREFARQFDREMTALSIRLANIHLGWHQEPSPGRNSHRFLHRRNNSGDSSREPSNQLSFMRI